MFDGQVALAGSADEAAAAVERQRGRLGGKADLCKCEFYVLLSLRAVFWTTS
jgi:hypothetical protein